MFQWEVLVLLAAHLQPRAICQNSPLWESRCVQGSWSNGNCTVTIENRKSKIENRIKDGIYIAIRSAYQSLEVAPHSCLIEPTIPEFQRKNRGQITDKSHILSHILLKSWSDQEFWEIPDSAVADRDLNTKFIIFNTKFLVLNTEFVVFLTMSGRSACSRDVISRIISAWLALSLSFIPAV